MIITDEAVTVTGLAAGSETSSVSPGFHGSNISNQNSGSSVQASEITEFSTLSTDAGIDLPKSAPGDEDTAAASSLLPLASSNDVHTSSPISQTAINTSRSSPVSVSDLLTFALGVKNSRAVSTFASIPSSTLHLASSLLFDVPTESRSDSVSLKSNSVPVTTIVSEIATTTASLVSEVATKATSLVSEVAVKTTSLVSEVAVKTTSLVSEVAVKTTSLVSEVAVKTTSLVSEVATTPAVSVTTSSFDLTTATSDEVPGVDTTLPQFDSSTVVRAVETSTHKLPSSSSSNATTVVFENGSSDNTTTSENVTTFVSDATSTSSPNGEATSQPQSGSSSKSAVDLDSTSQSILTSTPARETSSEARTLDGLLSGAFVQSELPASTLVKSTTQKHRTITKDQTVQSTVEPTSSSGDIVTTGSRSSSKKSEKLTTVQASSVGRQKIASTFSLKTGFPFSSNSRSLYSDSTKITAERFSSNLMTSARTNDTTNGTADGAGSAGVALYISLSLLFGLGFIVVVSVVIFCLLRNYCQQFHRCCSKHPGRCKLKNSCPCVETCHYHGLHSQRLTETPDLISESVHAQITRIRRGSSHPDQIALLERSLDDQHSLNELDQYVFEDPDLMTPETSDLFVDCRLASISPVHDPVLPVRHNWSPGPSARGVSEGQNTGRSSRSSRSSHGKRNAVGLCFDAQDVSLRFPSPPNCDLQNERFSCARGRDVVVVENPYLKPSCHAHVDPGPNWAPYHPYDPVYIPHHDPIGMAKRLDKEGKYVTSPRLRMRNQDEHGRRGGAQYRSLTSHLPPVVPNRNTAATSDHDFAPVAPVRVSSRQSPMVPVRGASLERSAKSSSTTPMRISSRSSPLVQSKAAAVDGKVRGSTQVAPVQIFLQSPPSGATFSGVPLPSTPSRGGSRAIVDPVLDRCLPELPVVPSGQELSMLCTSGSQRDSTSSSTTIPGHEYSRVDFGGREQPNRVVTTVEVEPYETDSDSCRDGAYESIDFPKCPPSP